MPNANSIKVTQTGKGIHHWEDQLLENQRKRLDNLLIASEIDCWTKKGIFQLFDDRVTRKNIVKLHSHPILEFFNVLIYGDLETLETYTSINNFKP